MRNMTPYVAFIMADGRLKTIIKYDWKQTLFEKDVRRAHKDTVAVMPYAQVKKIQHMDAEQRERYGRRSRANRQVAEYIGVNMQAIIEQMAQVRDTGLVLGVVQEGGRR